jgi:alanine racemase
VSGADTQPRIEERLAAAGLPALGRMAWLEIDLDAIVANLALVRDVAGSGVRVEPVVKADAYGHGAVPVARALEAAGADGFSVALLEEALELRRAGILTPILVLYPVPVEHVHLAANQGVALGVGDKVLFDRLVAAWTDGSGGASELVLAIELETGLGRGGLTAAEAVSVAATIAATPGLRLAGTWSHLAAPVDEARSAAQRMAFESILGELGRAGEPAGNRHLAASEAILTGSAPAYEAVRPGLAIYGLVPDELIGGGGLDWPADRLRPAMALRARPVRVADLPAGHGVSYGPTFTTTRPSRIATLPLGYGDGWPRALSNRARALVRGLSVPLVGNVAMDAVMADVTDVPGPPVGVDDEFTLLGVDGEDRITAAELAQQRTTNSWEVVTAMSRRLARVYHAAAGPLAVRTFSPGEDGWLGSSSGTGTFVNSRSMRS